MWRRVYVKYPLFLLDFNETWIFLTDFRKKPRIRNFLKIRLRGSELFHADGRMDGHDEAKSRFLQLWESTWKLSIYLLFLRKVYKCLPFFIGSTVFPVRYELKVYTFFFFFCSTTTRGGFWPSLQAYSTPFYFYSTPSSSAPWALPYLWGFYWSIYSWVFLLAFSQMVSSWLVFNHSISGSSETSIRLLRSNVFDESHHSFPCKAAFRALRRTSLYCHQVTGLMMHENSQGD